jgi:hypothetical protein
VPGDYYRDRRVVHVPGPDAATQAVCRRCHELSKVTGQFAAARGVSTSGKQANAVLEDRWVTPSEQAAVTRAQGWALGLASAASFMVILDLLVVATALSTIRRDLGASIG